MKTRCVLLVGSLSLLAWGCGAPPGPSPDARRAVYARESKPELLVERGDGFAEAGDLVRAEQYYALALRAGTPDSVVIPRLLHVCVAANRYHEALEYAEPALRRDPKNWQLRKLAAGIYQAVGRPSRAAEELAAVIAAQPDDATAHWVYGRLLHQELRDPVGADREFRAYLRLAPAGKHAEEARAGLLRDLKDAPELKEIKATPTAIDSKASKPLKEESP